MRNLLSSGFDLLSAVVFLIGLGLSDFDDRFVLIPQFLVFYLVVRLAFVRDSPELVLLILFGVTFPLMWLASLSLGVKIHYLAGHVEPNYIGLAFAAQGLFLACLFLFLGGRSPRTLALYPRMNDAGVFWIAVISAGLMLSVGVGTSSGASIFDQSYDFEDEGSSSILFEYVLIPILLAFAYSGESRRRRRVLLAVMLIAMLAPLLVGRRLPATMVGLAFVFLFWRPKGVIRLTLLTVGAFIVLSAIALFRVGESGESLVQVAFNIENGSMSNNQGGVAYVAGVYMQLVHDGVFDLAFGLSSMYNAALSIFLPSSMVDQSAYINLAAMNYTPIPGNGGLPGVHFFVWGGVLGVIIAGCFFGWVMARTQTGLLASVYVTLLFCTFPRWMGYNVNIMFKMGVLLLLAWAVVQIIHRSAVGSTRTDRAATGMEATDDSPTPR